MLLLHFWCQPGNLKTYASVPGVGHHGGSRMTAATMIDQCKKLHRAENLFSCSYSAFCASAAATHHATMMYQISGCKHAINLVWRLPRQQLGSRPSWLLSTCLLANLPSKNTRHNNLNVYWRVMTLMANNSCHGAALPAPPQTIVAQNVSWLLYAGVQRVRHYGGRGMTEATMVGGCMV